MRAWSRTVGADRLAMAFEILASSDACRQMAGRCRHVSRALRPCHRTGAWSGPGPMWGCGVPSRVAGLTLVYSLCAAQAQPWAP